MGSISAIVGAIAFLGFLAFLGGIGLVVVSTSQGRPARNGVFLAIFGLIAGILFSVVSQGIIVVQPTEVAVVFDVLSGELQEPPRTSGTHIVIPIIQEVTIYAIEQQQYTMSGISSEGALSGNDSVRARSVDGQEIYVDMTIIYSIDPLHANIVHARWQNRYQNELIRPTIRGFTRDVVSQFQAENIYGEDRTAVEEQIETRLRARLADEGLTLTDLVVRDVTFTTEFADAIERKQIAEQAALEAAFRVDQERQEAERVRVTAQGQRDADIARAEGDARAIVLRAAANAEALRVVSEQIAANPNLIQYLYVQNLSDNVGIALVPSNTPFLFDFESFAQLGPDFVAPDVPEEILPEVSDDTDTESE